MKAVKWLLWILGACVAFMIVAVAGTYVAYTAWEGEHVERLAGQSRVVDTAAGKIEYATVGEGRPRLLIHGTPGGFDQMLIPARVWPDSVAGEQLIAVSRPGYLRTPITSGQTPAEQADLYAALLDELGVDRAVVSGASGGAPSALQFALRHPDRTIALLLIVPLLVDLDGEPMASQVSVLEMKQTDISTWLAMHLPLAGFIPGVDPDSPTQAEAIELAMASTLPTRLRRPGQYNDSVALRRLDMDSWPLEELTVPTLLLHGDADASAPYEGSVRAAARIPNARLVTFEDGGHFIVLTESQAISEHISQFLTDHTAANGPGRNSPLARVEAQRVAAHLDDSPPEHQDASMRTTLTLDPDVAKLIEDEVHRQRKPYKQVVNEAIRRGLSPQPPRRRSKRYRIVPHEARLLPGLDRIGFNRLADELEDAAVLAKRFRGGS